MCLEVVSRGKEPNGFTPCSNRCQDKRFNGFRLGVKRATYNAVILGRDVPLCRACAKEWPRMWDEALESVEELVPA